MKVVHTVVCKLVPTPEQASEIEATLVAFAQACNMAAAHARTIGSTNKFKVHRSAYRVIRETHGLVANLAIRAIARACGSLKVSARMHSLFEPTSIDYDDHIFRFYEVNWTFGLTLLSGRAKIATALGDRQKSLLKGRKPTAAQLVKRRDGGYYLHVQLTDEAPVPIETKGVLGVDLGIVNLATDSDGETFSGAGVESVRKRCHGRRKALQKIGTKSAKRRLRKIRMKESRYRRDTNHVISKRIVAKAKGTARAIALEDLQGVGRRTTVRKPQRDRMNGWAFHQLGQFIIYKALDAGVPVLPKIDPRNSSRTCSRCGRCAKGNRKTRDRFECLACGHTASADWNAAENIRDWAQVMAPTVGVDDAGFEPSRDHLQAARRQS